MFEASDEHVMCIAFIYCHMMRRRRLSTAHRQPGYVLSSAHHILRLRTPRRHLEASRRWSNTGYNEPFCSAIRSIIVCGRYYYFIIGFNLHAFRFFVDD